MGSTPGLDGLALGSLFFFCFFYVYRGGQLGVRHGKSTVMIWAWRTQLPAAENQIRPSQLNFVY